MSCPAVKLNSGDLLPMIGLGTYGDFQAGRTCNAVATAIDVGYRHIDTAWMYRCEKEVGQGIKKKIDDGTVKREDLFVVTKLWSTRHESAEESLRESLTDLGLDYVDLFLIHWPVAFPKEVTAGDVKALIAVPEGAEDYHRDYLDTWKDMETLVDKGLARNLGVSNFNREQLTRLLDCSSLRYKPVCNEIESNPYFSNQELVDFCRSVDVMPTGYCPLGRAGTDYALKPVDNVLEDKLLNDLGKKLKKTPAQVILRWLLQRGVPTFPKSVTPARIQENFQIFDFELSSKEMAAISSLNRNHRLCVYPEYPWVNCRNFPFVDVRARLGLV